MRVADALPVDEDIDVRAHLAALRQHAVAHGGAFPPQHRQRLGERAGGGGDADLGAVVREGAEGAGDQERDGHQRRLRGGGETRAVLTHTTGGSPSASALQLFPSFAEPNSLPLRVPK